MSAENFFVAAIVPLFALGTLVLMVLTVRDLAHESKLGWKGSTALFAALIGGVVLALVLKFAVTPFLVQ